MTNFFVDGNFYNDLDELMEDLGVDVEYDEEAGLDVLEDDWFTYAYEAYSAPFFTLDLGDVVEYITDTLISEFPDDHNDTTYNKTVVAIEAGIDVDKINSLMPDVWRPTKEKFIITKADIIKYIG